jgi:energy-coupling factor transporter ATP-binding protein EcfA2
MAAPILVISGPSGAGKTTIGRMLAGVFDLSVHIRADDFMPLVVNGWIDPSLPDAEHQNHVMGGAIAAAAIQFAVGGYIVVFDGTLFPEGLEGMAQMCRRRAVAVHYAVLRPDLETCRARAAQRGSRPDTGLAGDRFRSEPVEFERLMPGSRI